ncbi:malectin domain-containing carbohydrate-binding protein, partial [Maribacter flavus]|uniref:malectin domain-containing carbohydrate-binding protein n=1 Tax=Maribacter flavus TaxID=1658664 RepID=UPI003D3461A5
MTYGIPLPDGDYTVNLYMADHYYATDGVGDRVFSVTLEGETVRSGLDLVSEFGHRRGGMLSYLVTVSGGSLEVGFLHGASENPLVNAIEVLGGAPAPVELALTPIPDRSDSVGDTVDFLASASGGDESEALVYGMDGAPSGISIESATGRITGTLGTGTETGGPGSDGIHTVTVTASRGPAQTTASFFWNVMEVASAPLALTPISDRSDSVGDAVDFIVTASGGDPSA